MSVAPVFKVYFYFAVAKFLTKKGKKACGQLTLKERRGHKLT